MSDPNSSSLNCLCCGKYICKTVDDRSDQDNERFRASRGLMNDFRVDGLLLPFIQQGVKVVTEFHVFGLYLCCHSGQRDACKKLEGTSSHQKLWTHSHGKSIDRSGILLEKIYAKCIVQFTIINLNKRSYIEMYMYILIICDIILKLLIFFKNKVEHNSKSEIEFPMLTVIARH